MSRTPLPPRANLAEDLRDDEIHVWRVGYRAQDGRAPLRRVLAGYLGVAAADVTFVEGEYGRPALGRQHDPSLGFNWSHCGGTALVAVGRDVMPGIDVEQVRTRSRALELARRFFSAQETDWLTGLPPMQRDQAFMRLWTAKEAVLKAIGRGLAFGLHRLVIEVGPAGLILQRLEDDDAAQWQLQALELGEPLYGALAWRGPAKVTRTFSLDPPDP